MYVGRWANSYAVGMKGPEKKRFAMEPFSMGFFWTLMLSSVGSLVSFLCFFVLF